MNRPLKILSKLLPQVKDLRYVKVLLAGEAGRHLENAATTVRGNFPDCRGEEGVNLNLLPADRHSKLLLRS